MVYKKTVSTHYKKKKTYRARKMKRSRVKQSELKFKYGIASSGDVKVSTPIKWLVNGLQQGTTAHTRIGTQVVNHSVNLNMALEAKGGKGIQRMRVMLVMDNAPNGASFTTQDLFTDTTPANYHYSTLNNNYVGRGKRYLVLYDKAMDLQVQGGATDLPLKIYRKANISLKAKKTLFNDGNVGDEQDMSKGAMWLFVITDVTSVTAGDGAIAGISYKYTYTDA